MPPRDPRLRPYRIAVWILYFAIIVVVGALVIASIARSLRGGSPPPVRKGAVSFPEHAQVSAAYGSLLGRQSC